MAHPGENASLVIDWPWITCPQWNVPPVPGGHLRPASGATPVLLREGALDPVTPPQWASQITRDLSEATTIMIPGGTHGDYGAGCPNQIADAFFVNPTIKPDTTCIAKLPQPFTR
jgi:hypothetical protein